jgi:hypothetical protein
MNIFIVDELRAVINSNHHWYLADPGQFVCSCIKRNVVGAAGDNICPDKEKPKDPGFPQALTDRHSAIPTKFGSDEAMRSWT